MKSALVKHYLPKLAIDRTTWRMMDLLNRRARPKSDDSGQAAGGAAPEGQEER